MWHEGNEKVWGCKKCFGCYPAGLAPRSGVTSLKAAWYDTANLCCLDISVKTHHLNWCFLSAGESCLPFKCIRIKPMEHRTIPWPSFSVTQVNNTVGDASQYVTAISSTVKAFRRYETLEKDIGLGVQMYKASLTSNAIQWYRSDAVNFLCYWDHMMFCWSCVREQI